MGITQLGHTGLWVHDLDEMVDFYRQVLGLTITDQDPDLGIVFFSSRPDEEHHEFVLQRGRNVSSDAKVIHQISWILDSLDSLIEIYRALVDSGVKIQQAVTHGNAFGVYFFDPEGNRNEVYWSTGVEVPQPFRKTLNLDQEPDAVLAEAQRLLADSADPYQPVQ